jgi:molybdate transport system substrate-binding protein
MKPTLNRRQLLTTLIASAFLPNLVFAAQSELLIYCGITMVRPISDMAAEFEKQHDVHVVISQGGSEDLYQSLKSSQKGDLYLPGEPTYREKYLAEGLLGDYKNIGYNQSALFVRKGNPKKVTADLKQLLRDDLTTVICTAEQGSIGLETKKVLTQLGIYNAVIDQTSALLPDSRKLNAALKRGEADLTLNWRATGFFPDNQPFIDVIDLPTGIAKPQGLYLNLLTFSKQKQLAQAFIDYAASPEGQAIIRKHGFLDNVTPN